MQTIFKVKALVTIYHSKIKKGDVINVVRETKQRYYGLCGKVIQKKSSERVKDRHFRYIDLTFTANNGAKIVNGNTYVLHSVSLGNFYLVDKKGLLAGVSKKQVVEVLNYDANALVEETAIIHNPGQMIEEKESSATYVEEISDLKKKVNSLQVILAKQRNEAKEASIKVGEFVDLNRYVPKFPNGGIISGKSPEYVKLKGSGFDLYDIADKRGWSPLTMDIVKAVESGLYAEAIILINHKMEV